MEIPRGLLCVRRRLRLIIFLCVVSLVALSISTMWCTLITFGCSPQDTTLPIEHQKYDSHNEDVRQFFPALRRDSQAKALVPMANHSHALHSSHTNVKDYQTYQEALKDKVDATGLIYLISTDYGYIDMALNLYLTSIKRFGIQNYLYVCSDRNAASVLKSHGISHFMNKQDQDGNQMSAYGSKAFKRKTHIKTKIILDALSLGYTVFILDVDIVFLRPPLPYIDCADCDIQIQDDGSEGNTGFYLVRPTEPAKRLHRDALDAAKRKPGLSNQKAIDRIMERMARAGQLKLKMLSTEQFPDGQAYFEVGKRMFADDNHCKACVIVHNNWIVSGSAKQYRFKEHLLWMVDNNGYYSNPKAKYIVFDNPIDFGKTAITYETEALKAALSIGHLLNRIVILPAFHCHGCTYNACKNKARLCALNVHFRVSKFDEQFKGMYREHMFLEHPLVSQQVLSSQSELIIIKSSAIAQKLDATMLQGVKYEFVPAKPEAGASSTEILEWLKPLQSFSILHFHSLYKAFSHFEPKHKNSTFEKSLNTGIIKAGYRQY